MIPIPHTVKVIRPSYLRHRVELNDSNGLFKESMRKFNDVTDVSDNDLAEFKAKSRSILQSFNLDDARTLLARFKTVTDKELVL